jgi:hypothetical protein
MAVSGKVQILIKDPKFIELMLKESGRLIPGEHQIAEIHTPINTTVSGFPLVEMWGIKKNGIGPSFKLDIDKNGDGWDQVMKATAVHSDAFGDEIVASWAGPVENIHEVFNAASQLDRLRTAVVDGNKLVMYAEGTKPTKGCVFKILVFYRTKKT